MIALNEEFTATNLLLINTTLQLLSRRFLYFLINKFITQHTKNELVTEITYLLGQGTKDGPNSQHFGG